MTQQHPSVNHNFKRKYDGGNGLPKSDFFSVKKDSYSNRHRTGMTEIV